jgi:hypothetical protein
VASAWWGGPPAPRATPRLGSGSLGRGLRAREGARPTTRCLLLEPESSGYPITFICILAVTVPAKANLAQNGSLEITELSSPVGYFCQAGFTCVSNVADLSSECNLFLCGTLTSELSLLFPNTDAVAFDGGNFVAGDGEAGFGAQCFQTINGLTPVVNTPLRFTRRERSRTDIQGQPRSSGRSVWVALGGPYRAPPVSLTDGISLVASRPERSSIYLAALVPGLFSSSAAYRQRIKRASMVLRANEHPSA